ncbi:centriole, cilia and spindle-associated protein [Cololabis saira]|uniref:centriole, cilia and spindle-associated protein n=1 Tax=Cololabis saira TaxID=129043 RepID=UPI002AD1F771|nr:centriole, cilia and spindle-associated protein [Cololabis saira]
MVENRDQRNQREKMVTKMIRSEYMKKFKDPKWETYTKCYEEMLKYRLTRRLLEHTHKPWFWSGSDSDSDSGGRSPAPPSQNQGEAGIAGPEPELEECDAGRMDGQQSRTTAPVPRIPEDVEAEDAPAKESAVHGLRSNGNREARVPQEEKEEKEEKEEQRVGSRASKQLTALHRDQRKAMERPRPQQKKPSKSVKQTWRSQRVRPAPLQEPQDDSKESRHPFALYGSGEKDADIAARKTHNVGPAASTTEIHESALRAKTRRQVERQLTTQQTMRRRTKSADLDKPRKVVHPDFNPWLTEYMRCFSARSR